MSKVIVASDGARAVSRGSLNFGNSVELTGCAFGAGPAGRSLHGHSPWLSSRSQWRAGNHRRSMRMERNWLPFGSSMVMYRSVA